MTDTLTLTEYSTLVGQLADNAMASFLEMSETREAPDFVRDVVDENTFEEIVGFGSPLDVGLHNGNEDTFALSILIHSPNRHQAVLSERSKRLAFDSRQGLGGLFVSEQAIDYRFLAACALHEDVMEAFASRIRVHNEQQEREIQINTQAVPYE